MNKMYQSLMKQSAESGVSILSTANQEENYYLKIKTSHTRHPSGTKASGLKKWMKGKWKVADSRDRFGEAEVQSSRLRRERRTLKHTARLKTKEELRMMKNDLEEGDMTYGRE